MKDEYFNNREVLVGALKSKEQLEVNLKYNFYHIPAKKINLAKNNIKSKDDFISKPMKCIKELLKR